MEHATFRRRRLLEHAGRDAVDAYLVTRPVNVAYLTGVRSAWLLVTPRRAVLVAPPDRAAVVSEQCPDLFAPARPGRTSLEQQVADAASQSGMKVVGVEARHTTVELLAALTDRAAKVTFKPVGPRVEALRVAKDQSEVEEVRRAARVAGRAYQMFTAMLRETDTEHDMAAALDYYARRAGGHSAGIPTAVSVGEHGAVPGAASTDRTLADGSKLLIDFCPVAGYACRMTRSVQSPFGTPPLRKNKQERTGHEFQKVAAAVRAALDAAVGACRDGVPAREIDAAARKVLRAAGLGEYAPAVIGHGTGLEAIEAPTVGVNSEDVLGTGMVLTLRPGVHIPGWGGVQTSECVLVTRDRAVLLTEPPDNLPA